MSLPRSEVEKVARLARLDLAPGEVDDMTAKLGTILDYVREIGELDAADVEPMAHSLEVRNVFREDRCAPSLPPEVVLACAPHHDDRYYLVPPILE